MTLFIPRLHRLVGYDLKPVRNSVVQRAGTGGSLSPINRAGDHWSVEIDVGAMAALCGRSLLADIVRGVGERVRVPIPQVGIDVGAVEFGSVPHSDGSYFSDGAGYRSPPCVKGDGQAGSVLALQTLVPGSVVKKGLFFTLETAAGSSAHIVTAAATADADGDLSLPFWPMLWRPPADGDVVEMLNPYLEGFVIDEGGQSSGLFASVRTDSFVVEEG